MGEMSIMAALNASVAQLDRVLPSEGRGRGFESRRMRQIRQGLGSNPEAFFFGSSRFPGEGSLDFQEEVLRVAEAVGHALDHLDAVVHALENAGVHVELRT